MNRELFPRQPQPTAALVASYEIDWRAASDTELITARADAMMDSLHDVMSDEHSVASYHALATETERRGLGAAVHAECDRRRALPPVRMTADDLPF